MLLHGILGYREWRKIANQKRNFAVIGIFAKLSFVQEQETITSEYGASEEIERPEVAHPFVPSPDDPPWNSFVALSVWVVSVLLIIFVPNLLILPYILSRDVSITDSEALMEFLRSDPYVLFLNILAIIPAHILTLGLAWGIVTKLNKYSFRNTLGWRFGGMTWWHYVLLLGSFFGIAVVVGYYFPEQENDLLRILRSSREAVYVVAFMATFTAPIVEEVVYRGILYSAFQRTFGVVFAVFSVTVLFALVHVPQYYPSYSTIFLLTMLSLTLTLIRVYTGNLLPCIVMHFIFNAIQSSFLLLEPYIPKPTPELQNTTAAILHLFK